jgi:hypothetical protein
MLRTYPTLADVLRFSETRCEFKSAFNRAAGAASITEQSRWTARSAGSYTAGCPMLRLEDGMVTTLDGLTSSPATLRLMFMPEPFVVR